MIDAFGRTVTYLRLSLTDRCDLRCFYCMSETMDFLPRSEVLGIEELDRLCRIFIRLGIRKIRLTGGEPLIRRGAVTLIERLGTEVASGRLDELTLTTNGSRLTESAAALGAAGIRRINVSLDTLDPANYRRITRLGQLTKVLEGIAAAKANGIKVKVNTVALRGINDHEIDDLIAWCGAEGHDITLIEAMPLGEVAEDHAQHYLPLDLLRQNIERRWTLRPSSYRSGGPAQYVEVAETGRLLGFITPLSNHFCAGCNRVRVTCTGQMHLCLGQDVATDLRDVLRNSESDDGLEAAIRSAVAAKPQRHAFGVGDAARPAGPARHMNLTGG